jgi:hypothetical protein
MGVRQGRKYTRGGRVFCIIRICIVFCIVLYLYFLAPDTRDRCGGRKSDGASCLGCTLGTWLCSMSNFIIYHVSCYRFVSQHTHMYHIGPHPHAHVDTDRDSRQQQQPPAPAPAVAQIIQNNTKSSLLYYVLYVLMVLCNVQCIMYFRSLVYADQQLAPHQHGRRLLGSAAARAGGWMLKAVVAGADAVDEGTRLSSSVGYGRQRAACSCWHLRRGEWAQLMDLALQVAMRERRPARPRICCRRGLVLLPSCAGASDCGRGARARGQGQGA